MAPVVNYHTQVPFQLPGQPPKTIEVRRDSPLAQGAAGHESRAEWDACLDPDAGLAQQGLDWCIQAQKKVHRRCAGKVLEDVLVSY